STHQSNRVFCLFDGLFARSSEQRFQTIIALMKFLANRKIFAKACLPKPTRVLIFASVMILFAVLTLLIVEAGFIYQRTEQALEKERQKQSKQNAISFSKASLTPHLNQNVQIIQSTKSARAV